MSLNIKDEKTHHLAQQLSRLTGESMTGAVGVAVRERLERVRKERGTDQGKAERLLQIGKDCAARLKEPYASLDHAELLYDKKGLPR